MKKYVLLVVALFGCANWQQSAGTIIKTVDDVAHQSVATGAKLFQAACELEAMKCAAVGDQSCPSVRGCIADYEKFAAVVGELDQLVADAKLAIAKGRQGEYAEALTKALKLIDQIKDLAESLKKHLQQPLPPPPKTARDYAENGNDFNPTVGY
jgi:uncharacterized lipoprotein NlpE involved in copper resistance